MMRAIILSIFVLIAVPATANMTVSEIKQMAFDKGVKKPHFYKIEYFGKTSYLLGTYHWGVSLDEFPNEIAEKAASAETLVIEILASPHELGDNLFCESDMDYCLIREAQKAPGSPLDRKYIKALKPFIKPKVARKMNSFFELSFPSNAWPALISEGGSLDFRLTLAAKRRRQRIVDLEDARIRNDADNYAKEMGERMASFPKLYDLAKDVYDGDLSWYENIARELADYRAGKIFMDSESSYSLAYRNEAWVPRLLEELKKGDAFIAVGIGHLYGNKGLIRLLKERNLRLELVQAK